MRGGVFPHVVINPSVSVSYHEYAVLKHIGESKKTLVIVLDDTLPKDNGEIEAAENAKDITGAA